MSEPQVFVVKYLLDLKDLGFKSSRHTCIFSGDEIEIRRSVIELGAVGETDITGLLSESVQREIKNSARGIFRAAQTALADIE